MRRIRNGESKPPAWNRAEVIASLAGISPRVAPFLDDGHLRVLSGVNPCFKRKAALRIQAGTIGHLNILAGTVKIECLAHLPRPKAWSVDEGTTVASGRIACIA